MQKFYQFNSQKAAIKIKTFQEVQKGKVAKLVSRRMMYHEENLKTHYMKSQNRDKSFHVKNVIPKHTLKKEFKIANSLEGKWNGDRSFSPQNRG